MTISQISNPPHLVEHLPVPNFNWGRKHNGLCFLAGHVGIDFDGKVPSSLEGQSRSALANIDETLAGLGVSNENVIQMTISFVLNDGQSLGDAFGTFVGVKNELWPNCEPVGTALPVSELFLPSLLLEIEIIAVDKNS